MGVAIVAIPRDSDDVWKISSEKVPHLTLLFLGDELKNVDHVKKFVEHAATNFDAFFLSVKNRGVLGDKSADVLFFEKHYNEQLESFRRQLLSDTDIFEAYSNTEQFETWTPHLTLGYPESPAKKSVEMSDYHIVHFDRIALWTGNFEGVEFPLTVNDELSMSAKGEAFLKHYGVKGMKWGVIRSKLPGAAKAAVKAAYKPSQDAVKAQQYQTRAKLGGVRNLDNKEMQLVIQRMQLERQYKELYGEKQWTRAGAKWAGKFVSETLKDLTVSWLGRPAGGRRAPNPSAWQHGQQFANSIDGTFVTPREIGR